MRRSLHARGAAIRKSAAAISPEAERLVGRWRDYWREHLRKSDADDSRVYFLPRRRRRQPAELLIMGLAIQERTLASTNECFATTQEVENALGLNAGELIEILARLGAKGALLPAKPRLLRDKRPGEILGVKEATWADVTHAFLTGEGFNHRALAEARIREAAALRLQNQNHSRSGQTYRKTPSPSVLVEHERAYVEKHGNSRGWVKVATVDLKISSGTLRKLRRAAAAQKADRPKSANKNND